MRCQPLLCRNEKGLDWGHLMRAGLLEWFTVDGRQELNWAALLGTVMHYGPPRGQHQRPGKSCNRPANISGKWQGLRSALRRIRLCEWTLDRSLESSGQARMLSRLARTSQAIKLIPAWSLYHRFSLLYINMNEFYWAQDRGNSVPSCGVQASYTNMPKHISEKYTTCFHPSQKTL